MSTRGVIARQQGDSFQGRYHHWDSYPTGLGKALWELAHCQFKGNLDGMLRILIDEHPAGWSTIVNKDFPLPAGFNEMSNGNFMALGHSFEVPHSTNAECYCHGDRREEELLVTPENAAGMGCEYVYVFSTNGVMSILSSINGDGSKMVGMFGMGNPKARWGVLAIAPLDGPEPDWKAMEQ